MIYLLRHLPLFSFSWCRTTFLFLPSLGCPLSPCLFSSFPFDPRPFLFVSLRPPRSASPPWPPCAVAPAASACAARPAARPASGYRRGRCAPPPRRRTAGCTSLRLQRPSQWPGAKIRGQTSCPAHAHPRRSHGRPRCRRHRHHHLRRPRRFRRPPPLLLHLPRHRSVRAGCVAVAVGGPRAGPTAHNGREPHRAPTRPVPTRHNRRCPSPRCRFPHRPRHRHCRHRHRAAFHRSAVRAVGWREGTAPHGAPAGRLPLA
mmetsp:Transcript_1782/g.5855  ORF Transcript_1782/g.5855 Transcript_1782/m.5855 type:complete len:259 (+) Transcript_1782:239-1015(+)